MFIISIAPGDMACILFVNGTSRVTCVYLSDMMPHALDRFFKLNCFMNKRMCNSHDTFSKRSRRYDSDAAILDTVNLFCRGEIAPSKSSRGVTYHVTYGP